MDVKPRPPQQPIIFGRMWSHIFVHAGSLTAAALVSFALGLYWHTGQILIDDLLPDVRTLAQRTPSLAALCVLYGSAAHAAREADPILLRVLSMYSTGWKPRV